MDWVLRSPQIHSTFSNLGYMLADGYHVNENCNSALEIILHNILIEDTYLRPYRRSISFGQNIKKDIIPLFIHAKEDKTVELIIRILVNLSIPIECLLNVEIISKTDFGRHTIFEINNLLASTKVAFTDLRTSKAFVDFLKKNADVEQKLKLSEEQRTNVSNCLLLLRNILHIPEENCHLGPGSGSSGHLVQNRILWNIFSRSVDKIIIKAMSLSDANFWGVTLVQLVAILYKDQHVVILTKLVNNWLEASLSESSEDNESNTSPIDRASDSTPTLTSVDPASDSSDNSGASSIGGDDASSLKMTWEGENIQSFQPNEQGTDDSKSAIFQLIIQDPNKGDELSSGFGTGNEDQTKIDSDTPSCVTSNSQKQAIVSEISDYGFGTQIENQETISTSSNDDDLPKEKPVHQKPHNIKQRPNNKSRSSATIDRKRKKIGKRAKANIINVQGLSHKTPTDEDISNVLQEFTVDFLLKGYNSLVRTLHNEILTNPNLQIDTSHFFWLLTYFLKFVTQIGLDLKNVDCVLSFEIVSYLTSESVNLCEQFELEIKLDGIDLSSNLRRQHLVVTSLRELVQAIEMYKKMPHLHEDDQEKLKNLQIKMCETEDFRSMLVLLLRHYNPKYHSKQYLQDLIVTNHILMVFLDNVMKFPEYNCSTKMVDHIRQFATPEIMAQYGLLLEDYLINGEFVNDCIFTLMHHVVGELGELMTLLQPNILKTFTIIWKSDFEVCDDWSDLIEYVIKTFLKNPTTHIKAHLLRELGSFDDNKRFAKPNDVPSLHSRKTAKSNVDTERWTEDEISAFSWIYLQCSTHTDVVGAMKKMLKDEGIDKTRDSVIRELLRQNLISRDFFNESQLKGDYGKTKGTTPKITNECGDDQIQKCCENLVLDSKSSSLEWVQNVLLEICYAKLHIQKKKLNKSAFVGSESKLLDFEIFKINYDDLPVVSPVAYHSLILNQPVPLVPWNCQQAKICKDLKFLQLLHKLGFLMPVDTGKVFIRIPHEWTAQFLFNVAAKIRPIDISKLKFTVSQLSVGETQQSGTTLLLSDLTKDVPPKETQDNFYQIHKQNNLAMVNFTPRPGPSFRPTADVEQLNWLQVVQKSQERKITLNLESINTITEDVGMQLPAEDREKTLLLESQAAAAASAMIVAPLPGTSVMNIKQDTTFYNVQQADLEDFDRACDCETASVASDLTRMYVSDEDEKLENIVRPKTGTANSNNAEKRTPCLRAKLSGKRRRE